MMWVLGPGEPGSDKNVQIRGSNQAKTSMIKYVVCLMEKVKERGKKS